MSKKKHARTDPLAPVGLYGQETNWVVKDWCYKRKTYVYVKAFAFSRWGGKANARLMALAYMEEHGLGKPRPFCSRRRTVSAKRRKAGLPIGVTRVLSKVYQGKIVAFVARIGVEGQTYTSYFPISDYNDCENPLEAAKEAAIERRKEYEQARFGQDPGAVAP